MGLAFERKEGHLVEAVSQLGIFLDLPEDHVGHLGDAGNEQLDVPLLLVLGILPVVLHDAVHGTVGQELFDALFGLAGEFGDLCSGLGLAQAHLQHDFRNLIIGTCAVEDDVFRILLGQLFNAEFVGKTVCNHFAKFE